MFKNTVRPPLAVENKYVGWLLFAIGVTTGVHFDLLGTIFGADILVVFLIICMVSTRAIEITDRYVAITFILLGCMLLSAMVADIVNHSTVENYLRGWSKVIMFGIALYVSINLTRNNPKRLLLYIVGLAIGELISFVFFPTLYQTEAGGNFEDSFWKFGVAPPLSYLTVAIASTPWKGKAPGVIRKYIPLLVMMLVNLYYNYRSMVGFLLATAAFTFLSDALKVAFPGRKVITPLSSALIIVLGAITFSGGLTFMNSLAESGALGVHAQDKAERQGKAGLLGARPESPAAFAAIADSPVFGHGSWAEGRKYVMIEYLFLRYNGVDDPSGLTGTRYLIPSHSHLLGAWVEWGVVGAIFWAWLFFLTLFAGLKALDLSTPYLPLIYYCALSLLWEIPFSPFGAEVRFMDAANFCAVVWILSAIRNQRTGATIKAGGAYIRARLRNKFQRPIHQKPQG
jgi:hypothetical protein